LKSVPACCSTPFTNRFLVQLVAWKLHVHGEQVHYVPAQDGTVMLRARNALHAPAEPAPGALADRPDRRLAARTALWRIEKACGA